MSTAAGSLHRASRKAVVSNCGWQRVAPASSVVNVQGPPSSVSYGDVPLARTVCPAWTSTSTYTDVRSRPVPSCCSSSNAYCAGSSSAPTSIVLATFEMAATQTPLASSQNLEPSQYAPGAAS